MTPRLATSMAQRTYRGPRPVQIKFRAFNGAECTVSSHPKLVSTNTAIIAGHEGQTILSVGGVAVPPGSNGEAYYDTNNRGPYWASDL